MDKNRRKNKKSINPVDISSQESTTNNQPKQTMNKSTNGIIETDEDKKLILMRIAELELQKSDDQICKDFMCECKMKCEQYSLNESDITESLAKFNAFLAQFKDSSDTISLNEESYEHIRKLFNDKISFNNNLKKEFMNDLSEYKQLLSMKRQNFKSNLDTLLNLKSQKNLNESVKKVRDDIIEKLNNYKIESGNILKQEMMKNNDAKSNYEGILQEAIEKIKAENIQTEMKIAENVELNEKLNELKAYLENQKSHYSKQIETQILYSKLYSAKLSHRNEVQINLDKDIDLLNELIKKSSDTVAEMQMQIEICHKKCNEFNESIKHSNDIYKIYADKEKTLNDYINRIENEIVSYNKDIACVDESIIVTVNKIKSMEDTLRILNEQVSEKVSICRSLQNQRNTVSKKNPICEDDTNSRISTSSSSMQVASSSSSRLHVYNPPGRDDGSVG